MVDELAGLERVASAPRMTESGMLQLLRERYTRIRPGTTADRFVRAQHVRYPAERYVGEARAIADYMVVDTYAEHEILGFEVKVTRADWLAELRNPRKAEYWRQHCNRWYLVTSSKDIVRDDLPEGWGHLTIGNAGLRIANRAPALAADPMPARVLASWARSIAQTRTHELEADAATADVEELRGGEPCDAETHAWDHYRPEQLDSYWIRCTLTGEHDVHEDAHTGLTWRSNA